MRILSSGSIGPYQTTMLADGDDRTGMTPTVLIRFNAVKPRRLANSSKSLLAPLNSMSRLRSRYLTGSEAPLHGWVGETGGLPDVFQYYDNYGQKKSAIGTLKQFLNPGPYNPGIPGSMIVRHPKVLTKRKQVPCHARHRRQT
jgi:hypothetical protein